MEFINASKKCPNEIEIKIILIISEANSGELFFKYRVNNKYSDFLLMNLNYNSPIDVNSFHIKVKESLGKEIFHLKILESTFSSYDMLSQRIIDRYNNRVFLIFYDAFDRKTFENAKKNIHGIKTKTHNDPLYILIRNKYELGLKEKNNDDIDIVKDEEALEFAEKNNLYFFHLSFFEKYETGIEQLIKFIINEYNKSNDICSSS